MPRRRKDYLENPIFQGTKRVNEAQTVTAESELDTHETEKASNDRDKADHYESDHLHQETESEFFDDFSISKLFNPAEVEITVDGVKLHAVLLTKQHYKLLLKKAK